MALVVVTAGGSVLAGQAFATPWTSTGKPDRRAVPVLMYHVIADPPASAPYPDLYIRRDELRAQVRWLAAAGYEAVTLGRVFDAWHGRATLPPRPIVLTFDDGYRSHVTAALPILAARHWPGVLNLDVSNLAPPWGVGLTGVRKLIAAGWAVDAHSLTHADLALASGATLTQEISGSRREILRLFGVLPRFFCYPAGRYDAEAVAAVKAAGYEGATTTEPGLARPDEPFTLERIRMDRGDGAAGLARKLARAGLPVDPKGRSALPRQARAETSGEEARIS
ncbi:MAG TPA: polysaccharide deacetylase family protein [Gaiella sp.]|nr:polysaccharide deacetylase family protein [Gaiella sp.]